jgi:hypothetical protein
MMSNPGVAELLRRYERWRWIYSYAGIPARDEPVWDGSRVHLRSGYPYPDWTGYIIEPEADGCNVLEESTERRNDPVEALKGYFANFDDASKYLTLKIGDSLRISLHLDPLLWSWEDSGLDSRVEQTSLGQFKSKFDLKDDPRRYFVLEAGGVQPENRLLAVSYAELESDLLKGMPESVSSRLTEL